MATSRRGVTIRTSGLRAVLDVSGDLIVTETIGDPRASVRGARPGLDVVDWTSVSQLVAAGDPVGRALLSDDPALGFNDRSRPLNNQSPAAPDSAGRPHRPLAVLLLEPAEALMAWDPVTNRRRDLLAELLVQRGFRRFAVDMPVPGPQVGWTLEVEPSGLALRDRGANVWARPTVRPDEPWLAAAAGHGYVVILFGSCLGVRIPQGVRSEQYGPRQRAAELKQGRLCGLVAVAAVPWQP
jgi:hypothetical protein